MSEQANEQIPGQGTLDDDATSATEIPVMPDRFLPEADALDERDDKKADEGDEPADTSNTPDPTVGSAPNADTTTPQAVRTLPSLLLVLARTHRMSIVTG